MFGVFRDPSCIRPNLEMQVRAEFEEVELPQCPCPDCAAEREAEPADLLAGIHHAMQTGPALNDDASLAAVIGAPLTEPSHFAAY